MTPEGQNDPDLDIAAIRELLLTNGQSSRNWLAKQGPSTHAIRRRDMNAGVASAASGRKGGVQIFAAVCIKVGSAGVAAVLKGGGKDLKHQVGRALCPTVERRRLTA